MGPELIVTEFLHALRISSDRLIRECETLEDLERIRVILVGKAGILTNMQKEMGRLIKEDRKCQQMNEQN